MSGSILRLKKIVLGIAIGAMMPMFAHAASDTGLTVDMNKYSDREKLPDFTSASCPDTPRTLTKIKDNLYRHTNGSGLAVHSGLVLITSEGALVIDPAMTCTSEWLKNEIAIRFGVKVKYVVYTHGHADHISGGQVFKADGATIVANQRALEPIVGEKLATAIPNKVFDREMNITLGGETVNLYHIAPSHSDSMTMVLFPKQRALQCTDVCESMTPPYNDLLDFYYTGWIETLDWVLKQDVDVIDVGHYTPATKADQAQLRDYLISLHQQVLDLVRAGQSWDQLYRNVKFRDEWKAWTAFDVMKMPNILGMYRWVSNHRRGNW